MKKILISVIIFSVLFNLSSCVLIKLFFNFTYAPDGKEDLYTAAVYNVFGASGYASNGEAAFSPEITVVETDSFGRTLFYYSECNLYYECEPSAFLITQKRADGKVYYYQDDCVLPFIIPQSALDEVTSSERTSDKGFESLSSIVIRNYLPSEDIEILKERNDWNKETDLSKCTASNTVRRKNDNKNSGRNDQFDDYVEKYVTENGAIDGSVWGKYSYTYSTVCNKDDNGLELYCTYATLKKAGESETGEYAGHYYALIYNSKNEKTQLIEITDKISCYDALSEFKAQLGWKKPEKCDF